MSGLPLAAFIALAAGAIPSPAASVPNSAAMDAAVADLCRREVAMLGEASHGDGRTLEFKAELVRRLIEECGYDAVYFESSHYDFLEFSRRLRAGKPVTEEMLSSSVGGIWNRYAEVKPLIRFLFEKAKSGRLVLGGLDDQLGSAGAFFSLREMPERLMNPLAGARQAECREAIRRRIYSDYDAGAYGEAERARIGQCLREAGRAIRRTGGEPERSDRLQMLRNITRYLARDFAGEAARLSGRDRSMYLNFRWLAARLPPRSRIIVWGATAHVARDAAAAPGFAGVRNFGSFVHRAYGHRVFSLGFSARAGLAPPDTIESRALGGGGSATVYRGKAWLARMGTIAGGVFSHRVANADWSKALDGLVVFRTERPPQPAK